MKRNVRLLSEAVAMTLLVSLAVWSFLRFESARAQYKTSVASLSDAGTLVTQIELLRLKPDRAATQSRSTSALAEAVEKAAVDASLAREQVVRIEPQSPRQVADYLEHPTAVQIDGANLVRSSDPTGVATIYAYDRLDQLMASSTAEANEHDVDHALFSH